METTASVRGVRLSAQKGRLVADLIRGKPVDKALNILGFTQKKAAGIIRKALQSAIANAEHNHGADIDELKVSTVEVNEAPTFRADQMPYGGVKDSGNTREGPAWAVREMTEERLVVVQL